MIPPALDPSGRDRPPLPGEPILAVRDLALGYGPRTVLSGITLDLDRGDYLGIVGPNGSGKSTLLMGLLGILPPRTGSMVRHVPLRFGYVPQRDSIDPIFPLSVEDVVMMGPGISGGESGIDVDALLERVRLEAHRGRAFRELSGGQKQRVLLARALAMNPDVLILDEPTNGLDLPSEMAFLDLVREFHREGRNIIMVTHFLNLVANQAGKIALVGGGRVAVGRGEKLLTDEALSKVYGVPIHVGTTEGHRFVLPSPAASGTEPGPAAPVEANRELSVTEITFSGAAGPLTGSEAGFRLATSFVCLAALIWLFLVPALPAWSHHPPPRHSLLALGLVPLILWAVVRHAHRTGEPGKLRRVLDVAAGVLGLVTLAEVSTRITVETGHLGAALVPEVTAALLIGSVAAFLLARLSWTAGLGLGLGLHLLAWLLAGAIHRFPLLVDSFHLRAPLAGMIAGAFHLILAAVAFRLVAAVHRRKVELPPRFLESPEGLPIRVHVPFVMLGVWPLALAVFLVGFLRAMASGSREVFGMHGRWMDHLLSFFSSGSWGEALLVAVLLFPVTPLVFRLLHSSRRLAILTGHGRKDVETIFRPWIENEMVLHAVYLALVTLASRAWLGGPLAPLGWGFLALPIVIGTLVELVDDARTRRRVEVGGSPVVVASCADPLEAAIVETLLKRAGIRAARRSWTPRTVLPLGTTFLAVTEVMVAPGSCAAAREVLTARHRGGTR